MIARVLAAVLVSVATLSAFSQAPSPTAGPDRQRQQEQTAGNGRKTPNNQYVAEPGSPIVNQTQADRDDTKENQQRSDGQNESANKQWTDPEVVSAWSTVVIAVATLTILFVYIQQLRAMNRQAKHMQDGLEHTKIAANAAEKNADAATQQARLTRQQMVATLGAVVHCGHSLTQENATLYLSLYFQNRKQATARDLEGTITITHVLAPELTPIGEPIVHSVLAQELISEDAVAAKYALDRNWLPNPTDSTGHRKRDNWDDFVKDLRTITVAVAYSYDNGFGDRITAPDLSQVFFASWWCEHAGRGGGGGGFIETKNALETWKEIKNKKAKAARGIDPFG